MTESPYKQGDETERNEKLEDPTVESVAGG